MYHTHRKCRDYKTILSTRAWSPYHSTTILSLNILIPEIDMKGYPQECYVPWHEQCIYVIQLSYVRYRNNWLGILSCITKLKGRYKP